MDYIEEFEEAARGAGQTPMLVRRRDHHFDFCMTLIQARYRQRLSQTKLAELIGSSQNVISRIESMKCYPSLKMLLKIAEALNVRITLVE